MKASAKPDTDQAVDRLALSACALALSLPLFACKDDGKARTRPAPSTPPSTASASRTPTVRDAGLVPTARPDAGEVADAGTVARAFGDAGAPSQCRLLYGPVQEALTGPATLALSPRGMEVVQHRSGVAVVRAIPVTPIAGAKPGRVALDHPADKASRPPCAVAGPYAFCSDAQGNVHRSLREMASDEIVAKAVPGARLGAAPLGGGHTLLAYVERRRSESAELEAWAKVDGEPPVRISEDGSGASDVVVAARRPGEVVAWMIDARVSMTPVHMRVLTYGKKLEVGSDVVVHVAGGTSRILEGALATSEQGVVVGLLAATSERGFGLVSIPLEVTTKEDAPFVFSPYPNGLDGAPLAATSGGRALVVARVRPSRLPGEPPLVTDGGAALPNHVLELGRLDEKGTFVSLGLVPTQGSVTTVATELDGLGAVWLHYTDASGSWLERRACP